MSELSDAGVVCRRYHDAWTSGDMGAAAAILAEDLVVEVPINEYPTKQSFVDAVERFGGSAERVELLAFLSGDEDAVAVYDMTVPELGVFRVAEHFTVRDGEIARVRQIHDTAAFRSPVTSG